MEDQFKYWEIENYTRVSAYDGRDDRDLGDILKGRYPDMMSSGEVGCTTSHLKALKMSLETDAPCALIMEDDCDLSTVKHWGFTWKDFSVKSHMTMMLFSWQLSTQHKLILGCIV